MNIIKAETILKSCQSEAIWRCKEKVSPKDHNICCFLLGQPMIRRHHNESSTFQLLTANPTVLMRKFKANSNIYAHS